MTTSRPKRVFLTFSTSDWVGTRTRLYFRALECGWFDEVVTKDESVVPSEYKERLKEPFHGFYFWKPIAIYKELERLEYGDILVYADSGSDINLAGYLFFEEKVKKLSNTDILAYGYTYLRQFCNPEILKDFNVSEEEAQKFPAPQAGQLYIRKTSASMRMVKEWMDYMLANPGKIRMEFDRKGDIDGYVQNRCDGSVLGCILLNNKGHFELERPNNDWGVNPYHMQELQLRSSECDILPTRKKFNYKPYVMFVIGQELPFFEKQYDEYTHFLNVGNNNLHRMTDNTGDSIHHLKGMAEQTGLYWIWKNVDLSHVKYIGVSTHRKPFFASNDTLYKQMEKGANAVVNAYYQQRKKTHLMAFDQSVYDDFVNTFAKYHPEDKDEFIKHEECGMLFPSNSFVMRVEDFYKMCEFVFPVALDFAKRHEGEIGKSIDRISHAFPAGCMGEDLVSFYIMKHICTKLVSIPFVIYPKGEELFRAETQPYGMIFGRCGNDFYPCGATPRTPAVIKTPNQYLDNGNFYPDEYKLRSLPNLIKSKSYPIQKVDNQPKK